MIVNNLIENNFDIVASYGTLLPLQAL